jgi:hypothetical protein
MKYLFCLFILIIFNSCTNNVGSVPASKYSSSNLVPLNDSTKYLYYIDAAYIEFSKVIKDPYKRVNQVELNKDSIMSYNNDLIYIYNNSYKLNDSFFECAKSTHTYNTSNLFQFYVYVDTNKSWINNWRNGITYTGVKKSDQLFNQYHLSVTFSTRNGTPEGFSIKSLEPINTLALLTKFQNTSEFAYLDAGGFFGGYSYIILKSEDKFRYYYYYNGANNSSPNCSEYHYWIVKIKQPFLALNDEGTVPIDTNYYNIR